MVRFLWAPGFFVARLASGLFLLKLSAGFLSVSEFAAFSQFVIFTAALNLLAVGGAQNGLVRQAAAAADPAALGRIQSAGLVVWWAAVPILALPIVIASPAIAGTLVGASRRWPVVLALSGLTLLAGPGQVWCSLLSGRKRVAGSLSAQAAGLLAGTVAAAAFILRGDAAAAAIAFASGGLVTTVVAFGLVGQLHIPAAPFRASMGEVRALLRYSAAFAATAGFSTAVLFGLRAIYRDAFGANSLGYWISANRISDLSTQLLGLCMIQLVVPHLAMLPNAADRRRFLARCWLAGVTAMGAAPIVFALLSRPLVRFFLSDAYLPAIPVIETYMVGDVLRVWTSLAMYAAFAGGRPGRYATIEIGVTSLMAVIMVILIGSGRADAPQLGYVGAYASAALAVTIAFLRRRAPAGMAAA